MIKNQIANKRITKKQLLRTIEEMLYGSDFGHRVWHRYADYLKDEFKDDFDRLKVDLVSYINKGEYDCYIQYPRNFANEYTCILAEKDAESKNIPDNAKGIDAEEFAYRCIREDDGATKYYVDFELIK